MDKFEKELKKYIKNFKDENFGDLKSLNTYEFEVFKFHNWDFDNLKYSFISLKDRSKEVKLIKFLELQTKIRSHQNENDNFKFYYFMMSLNVDYKKKQNLIKIFFETIGERKKKELIKNILKRINNTDFLKKLKSEDIFITKEYISKYGYNWTQSIFKILNSFSTEELLQEIYNLKLKYFYAFLFYRKIEPNIFLNEKNKLLLKKETFKYNVMYLALLDEKSNLEKEQIKVIKEILINNIEQTECLKYFFINSFRESGQIKAQIKLRDIFLEVLEKEMLEENKFIRSFKYGKDLALLTYVISSSKQTFKFRDQLQRLVFERFLLYVKNFMKKGKIEKRLFEMIYSDDVLEVFLENINKSICCNEENYKKWRNLLERLNKFCISLYYSEEFKVILEVNSIVEEILKLHFCVENSERSIEKISSLLEIVEGELLFKYVENCILPMQEDDEKNYSDEELKQRENFKDFFLKVDQYLL